MYLLDTDTLIYSLKGHTKVVESFARFADAPKMISVISFGELLFGARKSQRVHENLAKVYRIKELFPLIDVSPAIMEIFGELKAELQSKGMNVPDLDLIIGSTALIMGCRVVTNNTKHFRLIPDLVCENWSV